eukprot:15367042-Ditylum_brightwellii.AAC.5
MQIAPIPAFFVYGMLEKDLDATTILARVEDLESIDKAYMVHCRAFLHVAIVKYHKNDADIAPLVEVFMTMPGTEARSWAAAHTCKILVVEGTTQLKSQPPNPQAAPALLPTTPHIVCRKYHQKTPSDQKGTNNNTKNQAIIRALQNIIYDDAELSITARLLTTIMKKKWLSDQPVVTFSTTSKGLSSFAVPELMEELINSINMKVELLEATTRTTAKQIQKVMTVKPKIQPNVADFMLQLNCYGNPCYGLFGSASLAYLQMRQ